MARRRHAPPMFARLSPADRAAFKSGMRDYSPTLMAMFSWGLVTGVAMSQDGLLAVSASEDQTLKVWHVARGEELQTLTGHSGAVRGVAITADGRLIVSASEDCTLKVWDVETGATLGTFTCDSPPYCCAFRGPRVIVAGDHGGNLYMLVLERPGEV